MYQNCVSNPNVNGYHIYCAPSHTKYGIRIETSHLEPRNPTYTQLLRDTEGTYAGTPLDERYDVRVCVCVVCMLRACARVCVCVYFYTYVDTCTLHVGTPTVLWRRITCIASLISALSSMQSTQLKDCQSRIEKYSSICPITILKIIKAESVLPQLTKSKSIAPLEGRI